MQNTNIVKKPMLNYINVFRGLAIILILMGHTMQIGEIGSLQRLISFEIFAGGTALFVFIAGYLFQYLSYKFDYKNYLTKKWQNVIIPYLITAIPGILACLLVPTIYKNPFDGMNIFLEIGAFITTGRVHNVPTWFIPMITIFFLLSWLLLFLEKKKVLYKLLPIFLLITIFVPRGDIEPEWVIALDYPERYFEYIKYVLMGFVHFFSCYVGGMYFSYNQEAVNKVWKIRHILIILMLLTSILDIYLTINHQITNGTVSKLLFTCILLSYLKQYDEKIKENKKLNNILDVTAKYSFGLFFIHWYYVFLFNYLTKPYTILKENLIIESLYATGRFFIVFIASFLTLYLIKKGLEKIGIKNTRTFTGV